MKKNQVWNVPNVLSMLRLILSVVLFICIIQKYFLSALVIFIITAATDWLDGWWARHYHQVTQLGRILDPYADKVLICGTFILLAADQKMQTPEPGSYSTWMLLQPWMAVVIISREMLVTTLRSFLEASGNDFSAKWSGKIKMGFQCVAAGAGCLFLNYLYRDTAAPQWLYWTLGVSVWVTLVSTLQSGFAYILHAVKLSRSGTGD